MPNCQTDESNEWMPANLDPCLCTASHHKGLRKLQCMAKFTLNKSKLLQLAKALATSHAKCSCSFFEIDNWASSMSKLSLLHVWGDSPKVGQHIACCHKTNWQIFQNQYQLSIAFVHLVQKNQMTAQPVIPTAGHLWCSSKRQILASSQILCNSNCHLVADLSWYCHFSEYETARLNIYLLGIGDHETKRLELLQEEFFVTELGWHKKQNHKAQGERK